METKSKSKNAFSIVASDPKYTEYRVEKSWSNWSGRKRSGSFVQTFSAFKDGKEVGRAKIHHHANNPEFKKEDLDPSSFSYSEPDNPATYLSRIDNFTVSDKNPVKGVGSVLMETVENAAKKAGANKVVLSPSPGKIKQAKYDPEDMAIIESDPNIKNKDSFYNIFNYDPTPFYQKRGYKKDPDEMKKNEALLSTLKGFDKEEIRQMSAQKTANLSLPLK